MPSTPSMEEILASIKKVIAADAISPVPAATESHPRRISRAVESEDDVLELDDPVAEDSLLSDDAAAASRDQLASLSALRAVDSPTDQAGALEAVVREMLKPILKSWLDENLPAIVESLVAREISRISGRRG